LIELSLFAAFQREGSMKSLTHVVVLGILSAPRLMHGADEKIDVEALRQEIRELRQRTEQLERKLQLFEAAQPAQVAGTNLITRITPTPQSEPALTTAPPASATAAETPTASKTFSPTAPITVMRAGSAYMNIGFDALIDVGGSTAAQPADYLQLGGHDPNQRGFSAPNNEIVLDGAVDPYFTALANFVFQLDPHNNTTVELEEVYAKTTALPGNVQLKVGQYLANFGRQNAQHPHQWAFVDQPLILNRVFGPDGLRSLGTDVSWLPPTPFYTEFTVGILNGNGEQGFLFRNQGDEMNGVDRFRGRATVDRAMRGPDDLVFVPRFATSFDLTDQQTLLAGASAAFGPNNTGTSTRTEVYGTDLYWKWKSASAEKGFPFVALQTEALLSRFEAGADPTVGYPAETLYDYGFYAQALWGFHPRWVAGLRGDWVDGNTGVDDPNDPFRGQRTRISPNLTWYPTEFSKLRLQYNYDHGEYFGTEHSVWMQFEFQLGAHSPHKF
jgi:hypothetical protein